MNILITGGCGFIGSHLADRLVVSGHNVSLLDDLSTGSLDNVSDIICNPSVHFVRGSVLDVTVVDGLVSKADYVFHLASVVGVRLVCDSPIRTVETITEGTRIVVDSCSKYGVPVFIASTSEVYGKSSDIPFKETDDVVLGSTSIRRWAYAYCKAVDEFTALAYNKERGLPVVVARFFNTVGPRQTGAYGMVIPRFVRAAVSGAPLQVYGDGKQSRCFCHVSDAVDAIIKLAFECESAIGKVVNVGNDSPISINDLADFIVQRTGSSSSVVHVPYSEAYPHGGFEDMMCRIPCLDLIRTLTGFSCGMGLHDIVDDVADYVKAER